MRRLADARRYPTNSPDEAFFQLAQIFIEYILRCSGSPAATLQQEHGEVRGERLSGKLPHH
jgi:hypothetical protein